MIKFCTQCAGPTARSVPEGDSLLRDVCTQCGHIHYENPKLVVGCVAEWEGRILLCRRAIEPRLGLWTLPAGFMENSETTAQAAARETQEEACATVEITAPFAMVNVAHISQVHLFYRGYLATPDYGPGPESLDVSLVLENEIPWNELAFHSVTTCLQRYLDDRKAGHFSFHSIDLSPLPH